MTRQEDFLWIRGSVTNQTVILDVAPCEVGGWNMHKCNYGRRDNIIAGMRELLMPIGISLQRKWHKENKLG